MTSLEETLTPQATMQEILEAFPGAQRALFRRYHIGGCSSCSFKPSETLQQICARNNHLDAQAVLEQLKASHRDDEKVLIAPDELDGRRRKGEAIKLLDVRSRQEFEAVHIDGSVWLSQPAMQDILAHWSRDEMLVVIDHRGRSGLDAAAYFAGHGFNQVRSLRGGIDAWSEQVDPSLPRYQLA